MLELSASNMIGVPIESLVAGMVVPADVYVSLSESRFVLVFKSGASIVNERLQEFSKRGVRELFVLKKDYPLFFGRQFAIAGIVITHPKAAVSQKLSFLHVAGELMWREFEERGFGGEALAAAKQTADSVVTLVNSEPSLMKLILKLNSFSEKAFNHSVGRLWDMKINPLARVAALSEAFCELILTSDINPPPKTPQEALLHIEAIMGQPFNKEVFKSLRGLLKPATDRKSAA